jgi:hypothetical protein
MRRTAREASVRKTSPRNLSPEGQFHLQTGRFMACSDQTIAGVVTKGFMVKKNFPHQAAI